MLRKIFQSLNQKGQALVLYALLTPLMFLAGGAAVDLGWYYFNVAQLQNAADAAVLAGAIELKSDIYVNPTLTNSSAVEDLKKLYDYDFPEKMIADRIADKFLQTNYIDTGKETLKTENYSLYEDDGDKNLYYVVKLERKDFEHLFKIMDGIDLKVEATSVAKLDYQEPPEPPAPPPDEVEEDLPELKATNVVSGNWEIEDAKSKGNWKAPTENLDNYFVQNALHNYDNDNKVWLNYNNPNDTNYYNAGDYYRYSTVEVKPGNGRLRTGGNSNIKTPDSITFGFRQDIIRIKPGALEIKADGRPGLISGKSATETLFEEDWDIRRDTPYDRKLEIKYINGKFVNGGGNGTWWTQACDLRIHAIFNIYNFDVRKDKYDKNNPHDILWVRIESEAFMPLAMLGVTGSKTTSHRQFKSVRQIFINIKEDNTLKDSDGKFKYRPMVFFYDGPEKIDMNSHVRDSKPVILNLEKDFRGILFAPRSPVILIDNGHKFFGFIVAKEYRELVKGNHTVRYNSKVFVNDYGEIFSRRKNITSCGTYDTFGIVSFNDYDYELEDHSQENLFIY